MKILFLILLTSLPAIAIAQDTIQQCNHLGECVDTGTPAGPLKDAGTAMSGITKSSVGGGAGFGNMSANQAECDSQGNCTSTGTFSTNASEFFGPNQANVSGTPTEGVTGSYTMQNTIEISCNYHKNYVLGSGVTIRIDDCVIDASNNVTSLTALVCHNTLKQDGCDEDDPTDWSGSAPFSSTTLPFINSVTRTLDPQVTATVSCSAGSRKCRLDTTTEVKLEGTVQELGEQANDKRTDPNSYLSGQQIAERRAEDPTYQSMESGLGADMADCAQNSLVGLADDGYLLSCDGSTSVSLEAECTEVATCLTTETTVITMAKQCEAFVPLAAQTCHVTTPHGSCEVFLEAHEKICDTVTPNGDCIKELENVIQICDTHIPNGSCSNELEVDNKACVYSVPTGSCNVELLESTATCTSTIPRGECSAEVDTFVNTCREDVSELVDCFLSIETSQSECIATPNYQTQKCESTREARDEECSITYEAEAVEGEGCSGEPITITIIGTCDGHGGDMKVDATLECGNKITASVRSDSSCNYGESLTVTTDYTTKQWTLWNDIEFGIEANRSPALFYSGTNPDSSYADKVEFDPSDYSSGGGTALEDEDRSVTGSPIPGGGYAKAMISGSSFSCNFFVPSSSGGGYGGGGSSSTYDFEYRIYKDGELMGSNGYVTWSMPGQTSGMTVSANPKPDESGAKWEIECQLKQAYYASTARITYQSQGGGISWVLTNTCETQGLE